MDAKEEHFIQPYIHLLSYFKLSIRPWDKMVSLACCVLQNMTSSPGWALSAVCSHPGQSCNPSVHGRVRVPEATESDPHFRAPAYTNSLLNRIMALQQIACKINIKEWPLMIHCIGHFRLAPRYVFEHTCERMFIWDARNLAKSNQPWFSHTIT